MAKKRDVYGPSGAFDLVLKAAMDAEDALADEDFVRVLGLLGEIRQVLARTLV